ncbi:hypothetical protein QBC47DRAFT_154885 [Echria macrotheca]|uniref:NAD-dependent epimerase/dehydratase domain-containing protein n=1 Tax=Echria macrotheca TaxID=438768 RepID=A0AAJ0BIA5_9PEZI|nr:hypothetical protein QBC47DRAFT_154885 [Echria macrotheca]
MTPPKKLLLTGVTGYIGGDAFVTISEAHPELEYTLLVRNEQRAKVVREKHPQDNIRVLYGTEDKSYLDVLEEEASKTDIILHTADSADDMSQAKAISSGIRKAGDRGADNLIYWIHLCGTGILQWYDEVNHRFGEPPLSSEIYDDIASLPRLLTLPDEAMHRDIDKLVLATNHYSANVKTAIVGPPTIYGVGRGPVNTVSQQLPGLTRFILQNGFAPSVGTGLTEWDNIHISDVSSLFLALVSAALNPIQGHDPEIFGLQAYYFCENGRPHVWSKVAVEIAREAVKQGYLKEVVTKTIPADDPGAKFWGINSRSVASRARKFLGWEPKGQSLEESIPSLVEIEAKNLGAKKL